MGCAFSSPQHHPGNEASTSPRNGDENSLPSTSAKKSPGTSHQPLTPSRTGPPESNTTTTTGGRHAGKLHHNQQDFMLDGASAIAGERNVAGHKVAKRPKSNEDLVLIRESLKKNSVIKALQEREVERIVNALEFYSFGPEETVCQQGTQGTYFFIVHEGKFDVLVNGKKVNSLARGESFGEIALIHNCPRSASVVAQSTRSPREHQGTTSAGAAVTLHNAPNSSNDVDSAMAGGTIINDRTTLLEQESPSSKHFELWGIPNHEFRSIMRQISQAQVAENMILLNKVPLFDMLLPQQKNIICDGVQVTIFQASATVCKQGEKSNSLYVLKSGEMKTSTNEIFRPGSFFGTDALLSDSAVHAFDCTVSPDGPAVCIEVKRSRIELLDQDSGSAGSSPRSSPRVVGGGATSSVPQQSSKFATALQELHFFHVLETALKNDLGVHVQESRAHLRDLSNFVHLINLEGNGAVTDVKKLFPLCRFFIVLSAVSGQLELVGDERNHGEEVVVEKLDAGMSHGKRNLLDASLPFSTLVKNSASGKALLGAFSADAFARLGVGDADFNNRLATLKKVTIFRYLSSAQTESMVRAFKELPPMDQGDFVFKQGDVGDKFYIIKTGEVKAQLDDGRVLRTMGKSDYFGERALMFEEPRSASIVVNQSNTVLWTLDKSEFLREFGATPSTSSSSGGTAGVGSSSGGAGGPTTLAQQATAEDTTGGTKTTNKTNMLSHLQYRIQLQNTFLKKENLTTEKCVGRGTFGTVKLVFDKSTNVRYALKCVRKSVVLEKKQEQSIRMEREILAENDHPFIVHLVRTFKDSKFLYFLTELVTGGELYDAIRELDLLTREQAQFYLGSICLAIDYLHEKSIAYRDLKPENVLLDNSGYIKLIDFGCAKKLGDAGKAFTLVGTPHYMAPEVILGRGYNQNADVWSMGVCLYEFVCGPLPFGNDAGDDQLVVFKEILTGRLHFPDYVTDIPAMELIKRLLCRTPESRIGCTLRGFWDVKEHSFFENFSFDQLMGRQLPAPLIPDKEYYSSDVVPDDPAADAKEPDISFAWEEVFE
ncbi:unnamed protein product [Amoebophrya sp. A120]|nr:unnamed protein product [Amoebophrya sp. A120]|eukprot:GSA120T00023765001.1